MPLLAGVKVPTTITLVTSKATSRKSYRYPYVRIPASIKALVEGRLFEAKVIDDKTVYYVVTNKPSPTAYKPMRMGGSIYLRLPIDDVRGRRSAVIELREDGLIVHVI